MTQIFSDARERSVICLFILVIFPDDFRSSGLELKISFSTSLLLPLTSSTGSCIFLAILRGDTGKLPSKLQVLENFSFLLKMNQLDLRSLISQFYVLFVRNFPYRIFGSDRSPRNANVSLSVCLFDDKCSRAHNLNLLVMITS